MMLTIKQIHADIMDVTQKIISAGLSNKENYPSINKANGGVEEIGISGVNDISIAMKKMPYEDLYGVLEGNKFYNFLLADGGMVQMLYRFENGELVKHKLGYYPSPNFESFQNESDLYMDDCIYIEILDKRVVPVAIRFDYDNSSKSYKELEHPKSHLTLGQYENCRIPVCSPITPSLFLEFILRSFYNTALLRFSEEMNFKFLRFNETATDLEKDRIHIRVK
ncbi:DUF2290 domain-containing protein [Pantoea agglomerans]|uniref:DUF2290 domain-containing protein n=1 Tax=Enterobacter agglomerans TaxID=549 RepID=UPI003C7ECC40